MIVVENSPAAGAVNGLAVALPVWALLILIFWMLVR